MSYTIVTENNYNLAVGQTVVRQLFMFVLVFDGIVLLMFWCIYLALSRIVILIAYLGYTLWPYEQRLMVDCIDSVP
jgi:hypothetical protein